MGPLMFLAKLELYPAHKGVLCLTLKKTCILVQVLLVSMSVS